MIKLECKRCGYKWIPRVEDIKQCPKCKSYYWSEKKEVKNDTNDK